jgi:hypothetical protein
VVLCDKKSTWKGNQVSIGILRREDPINVIGFLSRRRRRERRLLLVGFTNCGHSAPINIDQTLFGAAALAKLLTFIRCAAFELALAVVRIMFELTISFTRRLTARMFNGFYLRRNVFFRFARMMSFFSWHDKHGAR